MTRKEYEEVKQHLAEISRLLNEGNLTEEERGHLKDLKTQLSGALLSPWLPFGWWRLAIMLGLFTIGVYGAIAGQLYLLVAWAGILLFSPHAMGLLAYGVGRFSAGLGNK